MLLERSALIRRWIFVLTEYSNYNTGSVENTLTNLSEEKIWIIGIRTVHKNKLKKGDIALFYVTGPENMYFAAQVEVDSDYTYDGDPIYGHVQITNLRFFVKPKKIKPILKKLEFIKNIRHWGIHFQSGIVPISNKDYNTITKKVEWRGSF